MKLNEQFKPGYKLPNGAIVIDIKGNDLQGFFVFAINQGCTQPFVIWDIYPGGICEHGQYHGSFELAAYDWLNNIYTG